jgi:hypothetical protein
LEAIDRPDDLLTTVLGHRKATGSIVDESFQVHGSASVDVPAGLLNPPA